MGDMSPSRVKAKVARMKAPLTMPAVRGNMPNSRVRMASCPPLGWFPICDCAMSEKPSCRAPVARKRMLMPRVVMKTLLAIFCVFFFVLMIQFPWVS